MSQVPGRPFQPGNTFGRGRPKGSKNKTTKKMKELLEKFSEGILQKCMAMALKGDRMAMKLCMERLFPARRDGYVQMPLPRTNTVPEIAASNGKVVQAIARGQITPTEGESISRILEEQRRMVESADWEARLKALEEASQSKRNQR
jgi:hypothetical protein